MDARPAVTWTFLDEVAGWSRWVALIAIVVGTLITRDYRFALACGLGAIVDIRMMQALTTHARERGAAEEGARLAAAFGLRLLVKGGLLVLAFLVPQVLDPWGMLVGVLVVELTLMTVGAGVAAVRTMRSGDDTAVRG